MIADPNGIHTAVVGFLCVIWMHNALQYNFELGFFLYFLYEFPAYLIVYAMNKRLFFVLRPKRQFYVHIIKNL